MIEQTDDEGPCQSRRYGEDRRRHPGGRACAGPKAYHFRAFVDRRQGFDPRATDRVLRQHQRCGAARAVGFVDVQVLGEFLQHVRLVPGDNVLPELDAMGAHPRKESIMPAVEAGPPRLGFDKNKLPL